MALARPPPPPGTFRPRGWVPGNVPPPKFLCREAKDAGFTVTCNDGRRFAAPILVGGLLSSSKLGMRWAVPSSAFGQQAPGSGIGAPQAMWRGTTPFARVPATQDPRTKDEMIAAPVVRLWTRDHPRPCDRGDDPDHHDFNTVAMAKLGYCPTRNGLRSACYARQFARPFAEQGLGLRAGQTRTCPDMSVTVRSA